ncbi:bestrophin family protein [Anditalea andensis]|uniref:Bestrophin n=1 Tax=Anditalea andensis TaxID=1048983 RepID=A0A074L690_9BACT|nr:bestrophin family ion channel [Anditalea andensis]KEO75353.1 hypothetical protein EL17_02095 [Anditalea andensis]
MLLAKKVPVFYLIRKVRYDLMYVIIVAIIVHGLTRQLYPYLPEMPLGIPTFLGTAISVLLSFKMAQSYDRWWEARKIWGAIVNDSRSLVIQLQTFLLKENTEKTIRTMAYRQIAWCYCLGQSLRELDPLANMKTYLSPEDYEKIAKHNNKPLAIMQLNAEEMKKFRKANEIDGFTHMQINSTLSRLIDSMGMAERINNTIFPVTYKMFLHFSIYIFVIILSIALRNVDIYYEIPLLVALSLVFFLLEKTATHLQDPFMNRPSDISVTSIARTIEINIKQLIGEKDIPPPIAPEKFYIM